MTTPAGRSDGRASDGTRRRRAVRLGILAVICAVAAAAWLVLRSGPSPDPAPAASVTEAAPHPQAAGARTRPSPAPVGGPSSTATPAGTPQPPKAGDASSIRDVGRGGGGGSREPLVPPVLELNAGLADGNPPNPDRLEPPALELFGEPVGGAPVSSEVLVPPVLHADEFLASELFPEPLDPSAPAPRDGHPVEPAPAPDVADEEAAASP